MFFQLSLIGQNKLILHKKGYLKDRAKPSRGFSKAEYESIKMLTFVKVQNLYNGDKEEEVDNQWTILIGNLGHICHRCYHSKDRQWHEKGGWGLRFHNFEALQKPPLRNHDRMVESEKVEIQLLKMCSCEEMIVCNSHQINSEDIRVWTCISWDYFLMKFFCGEKSNI